MDSFYRDWARKVRNGSNSPKKKSEQGMRKEIRTNAMIVGELIGKAINKYLEEK